MELIPYPIDHIFTPSGNELNYLIKVFAKEAANEGFISNKEANKLGFDKNIKFEVRLKNNQWNIASAIQSWKLESSD